MGEAPLRTDRVLFIHNQLLPDNLLEEIRRKFANAEVTTYQSKSREGIPVPVGVFLYSE